MNNPPWTICRHRKEAASPPLVLEFSGAALGLSEVAFAMSFLPTVADILADFLRQTGIEMRLPLHSDMGISLKYNAIGLPTVPQ